MKEYNYFAGTNAGQITAFGVRINLWDGSATSWWKVPSKYIFIVEEFLNKNVTFFDAKIKSTNDGAELVVAFEVAVKNYEAYSFKDAVGYLNDAATRAAELKEYLADLVRVQYFSKKARRKKVNLNNPKRTYTRKDINDDEIPF